MLDLLLDSSGTYLNIGLAADDRLVGYTSMYAWQKQSEIMIPEINALLARHGAKLSEVTGVVTSVGPGSYTGARISLTIAKIIGFAVKCPVFAVSSLQILKNGDRPSVCLINARRGRYYVGSYAGLTCLLSDCVMTDEEAGRYMKDHPELEVCEKEKMKEGDEKRIFLNLLEAKKEAFRVKNIHALTPAYLKDL